MQVPFGQGSMKVEFEEGRPVETVSPADTPPDAEAVHRSIANPIDFKDFASFLSDKRKILVVVNDHTRSTPTAEVLKYLELRSKEVTTVIASGSHRAPDQRELEGITGGKIPPYGGRVVVHDSKDKTSLKPMGKTSRGTELSFNSLLFEADAIIPVTSVEPHYFAGYTGGRKFLLPALAGIDSITNNHCLAAEESSRVLRLEGNPVHEDFMEALKMFGRFDDIFSIQLVLNVKSQISYSSSGHIIQSFKQAVEYANQIYVPKIQEKADIVISVNKPPLDIDLYQSQKALQNVELSVKEGGIIILVSNCPEGIGDMNFYKLLTSESGGGGKENSRKFGYHKVVKLANLRKRASIFAVTSLPESVPKAIGLTPYQDLQKAFADATSIKGKKSRVLVVLDGAITVPMPIA
ncbi:MAG: nickel-dependent lactate racemase [Candidatus Bathyarchaeia archaeon]